MMKSLLLVFSFSIFTQVQAETLKCIGPADHPNQRTEYTFERGSKVLLVTLFDNKNDVPIQSKKYRVIGEKFNSPYLHVEADNYCSNWDVTIGLCGFRWVLVIDRNITKTGAALTVYKLSDGNGWHWNYDLTCKNIK